MPQMTTPTLPPQSEPAQPATAMRQALVVDDSRLQRKILVASLKKWGFEVVEAGSGADALEICREQLPDLILSDWIMPGMSGVEFCDELRKLQEDRYVYFILLTSKTEKNEIAEGLKRGADDFLSKPVNSEELRARITAGERILTIERELTEKNRLVTKTLEEMRALNAVLDRDLEEARKLQLSLVPRTTIPLRGGQTSFLFQPSGHVGGDLVGQFRVDDSRIGVFSLDVSGHGIASALVTARVAGWLQGTTPEQNVALAWDGSDIVMRPPAEVCSRLNRLFMDEMETELYFTLALAEIDMATGTFVMAQAGHPHPLIQRKNGNLEFLGHGGLPIGLIEDADFDSFEGQLYPGDRLFIYSDGVTECADPAGSMLAEEGLAEMLGRHRTKQGSNLMDIILKELGRFSGGTDFEDDVSGAMIEYRGEG